MDVTLAYDPSNSAIILSFFIGGIEAKVTDNAYGKGTWHQAPGSHSYNLESSGNWYDLTIEFCNSSYSRRFMGRLETGVESITDPAMGN
jgi:phospholipase C